MDMERFGVGIILQRPAWLKVLGFELDNFFKSLDIYFVPAFDDCFVSEMLLGKGVAAVSCF